MREGITTTKVQAFITAAHRRLGSEGDPSFNAVLFGGVSAYPRSVPYPQTLGNGDMILIDTDAPVDVRRAFQSFANFPEEPGISRMEMRGYGDPRRNINGLAEKLPFHHREVSTCHLGLIARKLFRRPSQRLLRTSFVP